MTGANNPLLPAVAHERVDRSIVLSFGDPAKGPHEQFDFHGSIGLARAIVEAYTKAHDPQDEGEIARLRGAMEADDERLRLAAARVGIHAGCDAPEMMADEILRLRSERGYVTGCNDGVDHAALTPQQVMESNSAFSLGDLVRKRSGSWWQGRVVGHYSTEQTPDGVNVQLDMPKGPVQIFPAAAMELVDPLPAEPRENPQWTSEELQQFADPAAEPASLKNEALQALMMPTLAEGELEELRQIALAAKPAEITTACLPFEKLPLNVINLVIAAREFWDTHSDLSEESRALDKALEPFASKVRYANDPRATTEGSDNG